MPWRVERRGRKWAVVNSKTGRVKKSHHSKTKAEKHKRALYANVPDATKPRYRKRKTKKGRKKG